MNPSNPLFISDNYPHNITLPTPDDYKDLSYTSTYRKEVVDTTGEFVKKRIVTTEGTILYLWLYYDSVEKSVCDKIHLLIKATREQRKVNFRPYNDYPHIIPVTVNLEEGYRMRLIDDTHLRGYVVIKSTEPLTDAVMGLVWRFFWNEKI